VILGDWSLAPTAGRDKVVVLGAGEKAPDGAGEAEDK